MKCEKYLNLIDDLVEGELEEQSAERVNSHIFNCSRCASLYESLHREKEMYARYLFDAEPSKDLWAKFQTKLEPEPNRVLPIAETRSNVSFGSVWTANFWRLPLAGAGLLILFGLGFAFLNFAPSENFAENEYSSRSDFGNSKLNDARTAQPESRETVQDLNETASTRVQSGDKKFGSPKESKDKIDAKVLQTKNVSDAKIQTATIKEVNTRKVAITTSNPKDLSGFAKLSKEEQAQILQIKTLEKETAKQIEQIEMLLRSFRNARSVEGGGAFDVVYEKEQARKLLAKNARLRRGAEDFGASYTEEILSKAEPHLLDIANLENNPAPEKILDIKERVKNQNIIASLQIY